VTVFQTFCPHGDSIKKQSTEIRPINRQITMSSMLITTSVYQV